MSSLPEDIIVNIFSRLPVKSILRFRCVCKLWCKLFSSDPNFIKMQVNHAIENNNFSLMLRQVYEIYSIDYDASSSLSLSDKVVQIDYPFKSPKYFVRIEASCNGLLCINISWHASLGFICLWNPTTKEYKKIPTSPIKCPSDFLPGHKETLMMRLLIHHDITYGFGYDCNIDDYKLIRIVDCGCCGSEVKVYTLGSNSWRWIQHIPYNGCYSGQPGVLVNAAVHWTASHSNRSLGSESIISFDIVDERFAEVPQPEYLDEEAHISLGVSGGCLCILGHLHMVRSDVWVMQDYGVRESWTKLFTIAQHEVIGSFYLRPIHSFKNSEILLLNNHKDLLLYDPKLERTIIPKIRGNPMWHSDITTYVSSLVSLNSGTYVGQEQTEEAMEHKKKLKKKNKKRRISYTICL